MRHAALLVPAAALLLLGSAPPPAPQETEFGRYSGYTPARYRERVRSSIYVAVRDGTRLAVDVYRPAAGGRPVGGRFPVVWTFTPYNRATRGAGGAIVPAAPQIDLTDHGYVVAVADVRGKGASFGMRRGPGDANETNDAYDLIEWLGTQPWSNGRVGMSGCSYQGATTLQAVRAAPPHLKAAMVGMAAFDQYESFAKGGITSAGLPDDNFAASDALPVDADLGGGLMREALKEHDGNTPTARFFAETPFRDDINPFTGDDWWRRSSVYPYLAGRRLPAVYVWGGGYDGFSDQSIATFRNFAGPKKLALGNWPHCEAPGFRLDLERLRFFDYWLKGIDNGVMAGPPVHYYVDGAANGQEWRAAIAWPPMARRARFYLAAAPAIASSPPNADLLASAGGGVLQETAPAANGADQLDPPRDVRPYIHYYQVRAGVDGYSLTYTLRPQPPGRSLELVGHPVVNLWVSSDRDDADVYVYLEAVPATDSSAMVIASGVLRLSHRHTGKPPYDMMDLPWQTHRRADARPLTPGLPVELRLRLSPVARLLDSGHQLRLAVTSRPARMRPGAPEPAVITVHHGPAHPAFVEVPVTAVGAAAHAD